MFSGEIGDPDRMEAVLFIDQADVPLVRTEQHVAVKLDAFPGRVFRGQIRDIARADLKVCAAKSFTAGGGRIGHEDRCERCHAAVERIVSCARAAG